MKTISNKIIATGGYVRCGHVAVNSHGLVVVEGGGLCGKMMEKKDRLCPIDRVVSAQEFCNLTGLTVARSAGNIIRPKRTKQHKSKLNHVHTFIRL